MNMKTLKELLVEPCFFNFYRQGKLCYETASGFKFEVPTNELGGATTLRDEPKTITFLKWVKPQYDALNTPIEDVSPITEEERLP